MPCVAHLMLVMLRLTPFVAHLMLVMVLNLPEQYSFQDLLFHLLFMPKSAEKSACRMDISLVRSHIIYGFRKQHSIIYYGFWAKFHVIPIIFMTSWKILVVC